MRTIVVYPGRFHPFHRGHKASYDYLVKHYGVNNVFVVSSDKQDAESSPFSFADKMVMMTKLGIAPGRIAQVKNPYQAREITQEVDDPENTVLIFAVSEKDMTGPEARFSFAPKKDGSAGYMQPLPDNIKQAKPMTKHAYVAVTPTVNFKVKGADANSASQIRKLYTKGNQADREQIIADLYGDMDADIRDIFDRKLTQTDQVKDIVAEELAGEKRKLSSIEKTQHAMAQPMSTSTDPVKTFASQGYVIKFYPDRAEIYRGSELVYAKSGNYANPTKQQHTTVKSRINDLVAQKKGWNESEDYIEEKWSQKYKSSINCSNPKGFSQRAHCAGRKKKVNESSGYSLQGSFTPDLTTSKVWLLDELAKIAPDVGTVYILGSWYGNLALYMTLQPTFDYTNIINVEQDQSMLDQSARMLDHVGVANVEHMLKDANELDYRQLGNAGVVINCSLTDMDGTDWFKHIPDGTLVVMQARDHDTGYQFNSPNDILDKFPLDQVYYTGTLDLQDPETNYQRFMVIGRK
jgi:hypothetical protein